MSCSLVVDRVTKRYGSVTAVNDVSFEAHEGRILGLLGPNGAGKTSTIRMITHITSPDGGQILFHGKPVGEWSQARMGYLPEERGLYKKMRVGEQLLLLAELKGLPRPEARQRIRRWLERFGAGEWFDMKTEELSKGMQQKVQFIATIVADPSLLILDEPFSGLDPINAELLREIILELKSEGRTILFASHRMEQVEQLCDDICLMSSGTIVLNGPLREVKRRFGRNSVLIEFSGSDTFLDALVEEGRVRIIHRSNHRAELRMLEGTTGRSVLERALREATDVTRFELMEPPLKEIFVTVVNGQHEGTAPSRPAPSQQITS